MFLIVSFLVCAALAIPTFGLSLVFFFVIKRWLDKKSLSMIFVKSVASIRTGKTEQLFHINRGAINMVFDRFCVDDSEKVRSVNGISMYWGLFRHPMINGGELFSMKIVYVPRGNVFIKAATGVDEDVLSDNFDGMGSLSLAFLSEKAKERAATAR